jgi:guanylate kinase
MAGKLIIFSAPSGAGKTTIVKHLLNIEDLKLEFSISACTRNKRDGEVDKKDYYFLSVDEFQAKIEDDAFVEWEEVYKNQYYGTLRSEIERIKALNRNIIFDIDVRGGINIKSQFKDEALAVFIMPPSLEELSTRLESRGTDSEEKIRKRLQKAQYEIKFSNKFDLVIVNEDLDKTLKDAEKVVRDFIFK